MSRATEIRKEIVEIYEEYEEFLRNIANKGIGVTESLEIIKGFEDKAEELLEEYKGLVLARKENNKMDEILKEFAGIIMKSTCDETNGGMDNVVYFIYDEAPII